MVYRGIVRNQTVILAGGTPLADGTEVIVQTLDELPSSPQEAHSNGTRNGVPVFPTRLDVVVDLDLVNRLRDQTP